ncbi:MAG: hypothetical protein GX561_03765 [Lentisphaerae bacterium]|jgi:hypothetical protein|nr:hypothetical protein [Lentisphaerota bacterium]
MFTHRRLPLLCASLLAATSIAAFAQEKQPEKEIPPKTAVEVGEQFPWSGGTIDTSITLPDVPETLRWSHKDNAGISARTYLKDWTGPWNAIKFHLYSHKATNSKFIITFSSSNPATEGMDYYSTMITLNFTGWKTFQLHLKELGVNRIPLGFDQITGVNFSASGWGNTPDPEAIVNITPIQLVYQPPVQGPRLTDEEFFSLINLDYPGLQNVKSAVENNDFALAKKEFVKHIKTREKPVWYFDWRKFNDPESRIKGYNTASADKVVNNLLSSCGIEHQFGEEIDWSINPTKLKYSEWTWQLSRHPFWQTLGRAYWATGDEKFAEAYVRQIRSWITSNPVPQNSSGNTVGSRWRTIETGIRMLGSWPASFYYFLGSPSFDDESIIMVVKSFHEHATHLRTHPQSNNWLCMEMNGLFHVATLFPEFKNSQEWGEYSAKRLYDEMEIQVYPDGAQVELAPGYHGVSLSNFMGTFNLAKVNEVDLPNDYVARLENMYGMYLNTASPQGHCPPLNDSGWTGARGVLKTASTLFPHRKDFLYFATMGKEGEPPAFTSTWMPYAGWYSMRSDWSPEGTYLHFEVGPFGAGHQHEDKLSFVIVAYGQRLLVEGGVYAYDSSQWRRYVLSARAHNIVRVDGLDQNRRSTRDYNLVTEPLKNTWITNKTFDYGVGRYDEGFGRDRALKVTHERAILFVKPNYWIVLDHFIPNDDKPHTYTSWFHYNTEKSAPVENLENAYVSAEPESPNLVIAPLNPKDLDATIILGQEEPEVQGWVPARGYECRPVATPTYTRTGDGQILEPWIFYPLQKDQANPIKAITQPEDGAYLISFVDGAQHLLKVKTDNEKIVSVNMTITDKDGNVSSAIVVE